METDTPKPIFRKTAKKAAKKVVRTSDFPDTQKLIAAAIRSLKKDIEDLGAGEEYAIALNNLIEAKAKLKKADVWIERSKE